MKKLINKNAKSPNVCFMTITIINEGFRGHIERGTNVNIFKIRTGNFGKAKISNFSNSIMKENIGNFKISMYNFILPKVFKPIKNIFDVGQCLLLGISTFFPELFIKIAAITKLSDNVAVSIAREDFIAAEDINVI